MSTIKHKSFSYKKKMEILKDIDQGMKRKHVMQKHGVAKSTLGDIIKKKDDIFSLTSENPSILKQKRQRKVKDNR